MKTKSLLLLFLFTVIGRSSFAQTSICDSLPVTAQITVEEDTVCAGDSLTFHVSGGDWGKLAELLSNWRHAITY